MENNNELSSMKGRLMYFLRLKGITKSEFARELRLSVAYLSSIGDTLPVKRTNQILEMYPDLNRDWLLFGEGPMSGDSDSADPVDPRSSMMVPLLPVSAYTGTLQEMSQGVALKDCRKVISPVPGADWAIPVSGDSMEPEFHDGSTLLIKKINDRAFIPWGNPVVIDSENGVLVKCLYPSKDEEEYVEARSLNPAYPPIKLQRNTIFGLYRILGSFKLYNTI